MKDPSALLDPTPPDSVSSELPIGRPRISGFALRRTDVPTAVAVLDSFLEEDEDEQRETFEYLKHALDETRAAQGERCLSIKEWK